MPRRDSISRPIAPISSVAGRDDTTRPRRKGGHESSNVMKNMFLGTYLGSRAITMFVMSNFYALQYF
jgi:hypothetical protein